MDPLNVLALSWQSIPMSQSQAWEMLSLSENQLKDYLFSLNLSSATDAISNSKRDILSCAENGLQLIPFWHPHYPNDIKLMQRPPLLISCLGDTERLIQPSMAVVGSRKISFQSIRWMESELPKFFKKCSMGLTSGGAFGVDQKAHQICSLYNQPSTCWLPSGLLNIYPQKLKSYISDIISSGGLIASTYAPNVGMRKHHFLQRNQFIAACSLFTFVVQAKRKSGTLITAKAAADLGKEVAVLPSGPLEEGLGGLDLIYDGARLVRDADDLIDMTRELMV